MKAGLIRLAVLALALGAAMGCPPMSPAQAYIPVTGSHVIDNLGLPFTGNLTFTVTDTSNNPVTYTPQGGSPTTATISVPVLLGAVQMVSGQQPIIPNPVTMSPANTRYRVAAVNVDSTTLWTIPLININTPGWSFDGYLIPPGTVASGLQRPQLPCAPGAEYNQTDASFAYPWICSQNRLDKTVYWTQNPVLAPNQCPSPGMAYVSPFNGVIPFCTDSLNVYATPGIVYGVSGSSPGPFGIISQNSGILNPYSAPSNQWVNGVDNSGNFLSSQPNFGSIAGSVSTTQLPAMNGGDVSNSAGSGVLNLITVTTAGTCGDATHVSRVSYDAKGRVTGCTPVPITASGGTTPAGPTAHQFLASVNGSGVFTLGQPGFSDLSGNPTAAQVAGAGTLSNSTTGNAGTATALAATPAQCPSGQLATGITATGAANCGTASANVFAVTHGLVYNTSQNTSMNATASQVAGLFSGCGSGTPLLKYDGTCGAGGGGGTPGGSNYSLQWNNAAAFGGASFNGLVKLSTTAAPVAAASSDVIGLWTGTCDSTHVLAGDGTCVPQGSGLTGQTLNYVPLATSATASSISSHFYESAGISGVNNPFALAASVPNVQALGPTFTKWTLHSSLTTDDGSARSLAGTTPNVAALTLTHNAWGGNAGMGGAESRTSQVFGDSYNGALVTAGIKQTWIHNTSGFGIGDFQGFQFDNLCLAGVSYGSDEGCKNYLRIGETAPDWTGTITGGTNTAPTFTTSGGCFGLENQACSPIPGGWMIDSSIVRGTGLATGISFGVTPCSIAWASTITTNFAPPAAGAWGCKLGANLTSSTPWETPVAQTFTLQAGAGTFAAGDHACVIGTSFTEQNIISAVSGTSPTQTITIPLAMPETDVIIAKGDCMALSPDADQAVGIQYALPVVSIDGSTLIATWENYSRNDRLDWQTGSHWSHFDGGASSGIHLYATARILKVDTTQPNQLAWNPGNQIPTLSPNSYFNVGDVLWSAHPEAQLVTGLDLNAIQNMPGGPRGVMSHIGGHGANADSFAYYGENTEPTSSYIPYGGPLNEPQFINQVGVFDSFLTANTTPNSSLFYFNNHQTGQTAYNILRDPTWGTLSLQSDGLHWNNDIRGSSFYGSGLVQGNLGIQAGAGTGNASGAGVRFDWGTSALQSPVWLAPHCIPGHTDGYLALTYQGASRTAGGGDYCATPDASLLLRNLFVADDGAGHNGQISFGQNYGLLDILMYDGGAGLRYGWGLTAGTMNFVVPSLANAGGHFNFTDSGDLGVGTAILALTRASATFSGNISVPGTADGCASWTSGVLGTTGIPCGSGGGGFSGSGTTGYLPQLTGPTALGNSFVDYGITNAGAYTSTKDIYAPNFHATTSVTIGSGSPTLCSTSPSSGVINFGLPVSGSCASDPKDATMQAQNFYAQGGIVDGRSVVTTFTTTSYSDTADYWEKFVIYNGVAGSGTITWNLPTTGVQSGMKRCYRTIDADVGFKVQAGTGQVIYTDQGASTSGGYVDNPTGLNNGACVVAIDSSNWAFSGWTGSGTWVAH